MDIAVSRLIELKRQRNLSLENIASVCGVSRQAVNEVLQGRTKNVPTRWLSQLIEAFQLDANYFFRRETQIAEYTPADDSMFRTIPMLGNIGATFGKSSDELPDEGILIPSFMLPKKRKCFALRVSGDSMIGAGIFDGDICIIEPQNNAAALKDGDIAAFRVDGDATLKYYRKQKGQAWLVPANPKYQPMPIMDNSIELIGPMVSLMRPPS